MRTAHENEKGKVYVRVQEGIRQSSHVHVESSPLPENLQPEQSDPHRTDKRTLHSIL